MKSPAFRVFRLLVLTIFTGLSSWAFGALALSESQSVSAALGAPFLFVPATNGQGVAPITYSVTGTLPAGLTFNSTIGKIVGTPTQVGTANVTVTATDSVANTASLPLAITVTNIAYTGASTVTFITGAPTFSYQLTAAGGTGPYTYSVAVSGNSLPTGVTLSSSGLLSGSVTGAATMVPVTINITDSTSGTPNTTSAAVTISIQTFGMPSPLVSTGTVGVPFTFTLPAPVGGVSPVTVSGYSSIPGVSFNGATRTFSGTPLSGGTFSQFINSVDNNGSYAPSATVTVTIPTTPLVLTSNASTNSTTVAAGYSAYLGGAASGGVQPYTYSLAAGTLPTGFTFYPFNSNGQIAGSSTVLGSYPLTLMVTDAVGNTASVAVPLVIAKMVIGNPLTATAVHGVFFNEYLYTNGSSGTVTYTATGLPPGLTMTSFGQIRGTPSTGGTSPVVYPVMLTATDSINVTASATLQLTVAPLAVTSPAAFVAVQGLAYSYQLTAAGAQAPYTFALANGSALPAGLTLSSSGLISGTAAASQIPVPFTVTVTDSSMTPVTANYTAEFPVYGNGIPSPLVINGTLGASLSYTIPTGNLTAPLTFSGATTPAPGLSLNTTTGVISGTPTTAGTFTPFISVADSNSHFGNTQSLTVVVPPLPMSATESFPATHLVTNLFYNNQINVTGGVAPYTYTVTAGSLPTGVTMNANGQLSGTPSAAGTYSATITVADSAGNSATVSLALTVASYGITNGNPATGAVGVAYEQQFSASGATGTVTYTATGLPAGLTLLSNGVLYGTATTAGTYYPVITATDSGAHVVSNTYALVFQALIGTSPNGFNLVAGVPFSYQLTEAGSTGPFTYAVTAGSSLPSGLTLSSSGLVSGTLATTGINTFVGYSITDGLGNTVSGPGMNIVTAAVGIPTPVTPPVAVQGTPYSFMLSAAGGTAPYTFAATTTLPTGLTLNTSTGVISGTPTSGSRSWTVTFTAKDSSATPVTSAPVFIQFVVEASALTVSPSYLAKNIITNSTYSNSLNIAGGYPPYLVTLASGSLPPGLSLSNSQISGTATTAGSYPSTVTVTDSAGTTVTVNTMLTVGSYAITSPTSATIAAGAPYAVNLSTTGMTSPYTWSATGLPPGLTLNALNGLVSGTPTTVGSYAPVFTVMDSSNPVKTTSNPILFTVQKITSVFNQAVTAVVGTAYGYQLPVTGANGPYTYTQTTVGSLPAGLTLSSSGLISGTPTATASATNFSYVVTDGAGDTANGSFTTTVRTFGFDTPFTPPVATAGSVYSYTLAASGGTAPYTYSITGSLPSGLTLNPQTGVISGTPTTGSRGFNVTVNAADSSANQQTATATLTLVITPLPLTISTPPAVAALVGSSFSFNILTSGGSGSLIYTLSGSLPPGLTMSSSGNISGTPTTSGSYPVTVTVTDGASATATLNLTISTSTFGFTPSSTSASAAVGVQYNSNSPTTGSTGNITFTASGLPPGLSVLASGTSAVVTGTPTTAGTYIATISATDSANPAKTTLQIQTITVRNVLITGTSNFIAVSGVPYSYVLVAAGGTMPYTFALTAGTLPAGITLSPSGLVAGTSTATANASSTVTFTVTDQVGNTASLTGSFLSRLFGVNSPQVANGAAGTAFSFQPALGGGTPPYTFGASWLPSGLTINASTGLISGTTTAGGSFSGPVTSMDSSNPALTGSSATLNLNLSPLPLTATFSGWPTQLVNYPYSGTYIVVSGGVGLNTYAITAGSLPTGMTLNSSGLISGTPTVVGNYSATVTVTDHAGSTATVIVPITVGTFGFSFGVLYPTYIAGNFISYNESAIGGTGTITYSAANLPPGLTYNASTGLFSGRPTTSGTYVTTLTATDSTTKTVSTVFNITVVPLGVTSPNAYVAVQGLAYSYQLTATGAQPPYTFALANGSALPAGLTLSSSGVISGTATTTETSVPFTVTVSDSSVTPVTANYTAQFSVYGGGVPSPLVINGTLGTSLSYTIPTANVTGPLTFSGPATPAPGLTLNATTGVISGTPTAPGTFAPSITVSDSASHTETIPSVTIVVPALPMMLTQSFPASHLITNFYYNNQINVTGGVSPYSYAVTAGALPTGITLSPNGQLSGSATAAGTYSATITVSDSAGNAATLALPLTVGSYGITNSNPSAGAVGVAYDQQFYSSGATGTVTYTATGLPAGLTLLSTGALYGTVTTAGTYYPVITATDSGGHVVSNTYAVVFQALVGTSPNSFTLVAGVPFSYQLTEVGSTGPFTYALTPGSSLPSGLTLSSSGLVSGTVSTVGFSPFVGYSITDGLANTVYGPGMNIDTVAFGIPTPVTPPVAVQGTPYTFTLPVAGGTAPYTFTATNTLPNGLTLNSSTGVISGTPTSGSNNWTVTFTVTDSSATPLTSSPVNIEFVIQASPLTVIPSFAAKNIITNSFYSNSLNVTGGYYPYLATLTSGSLPPGLSLSGTQISGTPTTAGSYPSTVTVTDSDGTTVTVNTSLTVGSYAITSPTGATMAVGTPFAVNLSTTGMTSPYSWSATGLPPGLSLNALNGLVSGTPTTVGSYTPVFTVTDSSNPVKTTSNPILFTVQKITAVFNQAVTAVVGTAYSYQLPVTGASGPYTFALTTVGSLPAGLTLSSSGLLSGTPTAASSATNFSYTVTDGAGDTANGSFTTTVRTFGIVTPLNPPVATAGSFYSTTVAATGGTAPYTYSITGSLPSGLSLNTATGVISGTPTTGSRGFNVTVNAVDSSPTGQSASATLTLVITPLPLTISTPPAVAALVGSSFSFNILTSGGSGSLIYTLSSSLPPGLTMSSSGVISGTPTTSGSYPVTITVTDGASATATLNLTISTSTFGFTSSSVSSSAAVGVPFSFTTSTTGSTGTITFTATGLPPGLSVAASGTNAVVSGTPTSTGSYIATITATDSANPAKTTLQIQTVTVRNVIITGSSNFIAVNAVPYSYQLTAAGGTAPYTFAVTSGTLPTGLTLSSSGLLAGTALATGNASTTVTFTVTDHASNTAPLTVSFLSRLFGVNSPQVVNGAAGTALSFQPALGGGTPPYTISTTGLPTGLSINAATGLISGTTTSGGSFTESLLSTDSSSPALSGTSASLTLNLTPLPLAATFSGWPTQLVGYAYAPTFIAVSGGVAPYTYAITAGSLPTGMTLSTSGQVSGTPTVTGTYSATVTVTDLAGTTATVAVPITVGTFGFSFGVIPTTYVVGNPISYNDSAVGGTGTITYSATNLPPGLTYNAATGIFSGSVTTPGTYNTVLTATDSTSKSISTVLNITVVPLQVSSGTTVTAIVGVPYSYQILVTGGAAPYTFVGSSNVSGPQGLALSSSGLVSGTATAAKSATTIPVTITDSLGATVTTNFTVSAITFGLANPQIVSGVYGVSLSYPLSAGGGTPPYTFSTTPALPLPTGLALASGTGIVSGTPTSPGTFTNTITVIDSNGLTSNATLRSVIASVPPSFTAQPAAVTVVAGGNATFSAVAVGPGPLTYQWFKNGSPLGVTTPQLMLTNIPLGSDGSITVTVTSPYGSATSVPAMLTVNPTAPVLPQAASTTTVVGSTFTYTPTLNGTKATFTVSPSLPTGLTLNSTSGVISGTPTGAESATPFTLTATNVTGTTQEVLTLTIDVPVPTITTAGVSGTAGTSLSVQIAATNSPTNFSATGLPTGLTMNSSGLVTGTPTAAGSTTASITATNGTGSGTALVTFTIAAAPAAPVYGGTASPGGTEGGTFDFVPSFTGVATTFALASGSANLPSGLTLNSSTGEIKGTPLVSGTFPITLSASGTGGTTLVPLTITINPSASAPTITSASIVTTTAGSFSFQLQGSNTPTQFGAINLPSWASLDPASGIISGTSVPGTTTVQVAGFNSFGVGPISALVIQINPAVTTPIMTSASSYTVTVGTYYSLPLSASGTPDSFAITSGTLPDGLILNGATIQGTPTALAVGGTVGIAAHNSSGTGLSLLVPFGVVPSSTAPVITSLGSAPGQVGQPFLYTIAASNTPTSYSVTGTLPDGLVFDPVGGTIKGVPTTATTSPVSVTITASSAQGSGSKTLQITIVAPPAAPTVTSASTASGQVGQSFSYPITASSAATSFVATPLPAGLNLDPVGGVISGKPAAAGTFTINLQAGNNGVLGTVYPLTLTVAAAPTAPMITSSPTPSYTEGSANPFSYPITATSSLPLTGYGLTGTLPTGLTFNTVTGIIAGTPVEPGTTTVYVTASNSVGTSVPQSVAITVNPSDSAPTITSPNTASGQVGVAFDMFLTASHMDGPPFPPSETLDASGLPPGLGVNPSTGEIKGTPTQSGVFTVTVVGQTTAGEGTPATMTFTVAPPDSAPVITSPSAASGQAKVPFAYQIVASNSPTGYDAIGAPAWMVVDTAGGALSGTPTEPGIFVVSLVASNTQASNPVTLVITVAPAANTPVITSPATASGALSTPFTAYQIKTSLPATGYSASNLPAGLQLDSTTGIISGTPTSSGTFVVPLVASSGTDQGATFLLTITIQGSLTY